MHVYFSHNLRKKFKLRLQKISHYVIFSVESKMLLEHDYYFLEKNQYQS